MKINALKDYTPLQLTITFESKKEEEAFRHIVACWNDIETCGEDKDYIQELGGKIWEELYNYD